MKRWMMRVSGGLNILNCAAGIYFTAVAVRLQWHHWSQPPSKHYWLFFFLFFIFNSALIGLLAYFGVKLIKGDDAAILLTSAVLLAGFMSFVLGTMVFWVGLPKYVPFLDTSADPLAPQILTGYPMIGLIVTLVLAIRNQRGPARL
jgi:succinate dehydrogenase hydrophobic anchor subunit